MRAVFIRTLAATALIPIAAAPARAGEGVRASMSFVTTPFDVPPTLEMAYEDGHYRYKPEGTFRLRVRLQAKDPGVGKVEVATVRLEGDPEQVVYQLPANYETNKLDTVEEIVLTAQHLRKFEHNAARICDREGGAAKVVETLAIPFRLFVRSSYVADTATSAATYPARVACQPKRSAMAVTRLKVWSEVRPGANCPRGASLFAEIEANQPGQVEFTLVRDDGERLDASARIPDGPRPRTIWRRDYRLDRSFDHQYRVVLKGSDHLAPSSTPWTRLKLTCNERPGGLQARGRRPAGRN